MSAKDAAHLTVGRVLVVDDAVASRRQLSLCLEAAGLDVTEAAEGVEGLWRARERPFDLVLTDIYMPTMDGLQFLSELRKLPQHGTTPVYILTSDCTKERLARGRELGATAWIVKPTDLRALVETVRNAVIARRRGTSFGAGSAAPPAF